MNKKYILQKAQVIEKIITEKKIKKNNFFVIYFSSNNLNYNRYCISIGRKLAKAHDRNKVKRRIKDILMKNNINYSKDYVIIVRNYSLKLKYEQLKEELIKLIKEIE